MITQELLPAVLDTLNGNVTLLNNSGTITFSGAINPSGIYQFTGNGGLIDITLPHDGAFHVDATANNNTVSSNFAGVVVQNGEIHANIGRSPRANVTIYNNSGAVALHAGNRSQDKPMSNSMQFPDPNANWNNSEQQNIYTNSSYSSQYSSSYLSNNPYAKLNAFPSYRRRRRRWPWIILTLILLLVIGVSSGLYMFTSRLFSSIPTQNTSSQAQVSDTTTILTSSQPTIVINSGSGFVRVHAGKDAHHIIAGIINPSSDSSSPTYTSSGDNEIITFDDRLSGDGLDLTVPTTTDLQIDSDGIEVVGVIGQMALTSPSGAITLTQSTVSGISKLG